MDNSRFKIMIILLLFTSCTHAIPNHEHVINVPAMQVIITDQYLPDAIFGLANREWVDGAWRYRIFIRGTMTSDGIDFSRYIMGHEMTHILQWLDPTIQDPHDDFLYKATMGWWQ